MAIKGTTRQFGNMPYLCETVHDVKICDLEKVYGMGISSIGCANATQYSNLHITTNLGLQVELLLSFIFFGI